MPILGEPLGPTNGFDDEHDAMARSNGVPDWEDGPGGLFPPGEKYPSNSNFGAAYDRFYERTRDWMDGMGGSEVCQKLYE